METRRVDEPLIVLFLDAMSVLLQRRQRIYCNTGPHFRARHDAIVSALGLPFSGDGVGLTPAGHRGGGATMYFQATLSTEQVRFRGGWQSLRSLDVYIQEVAAESILATATVEARAWTAYLAKFLPSMLRKWVTVAFGPAALDALGTATTFPKLTV